MGGLRYNGNSPVKTAADRLKTTGPMQNLCIGPVLFFSFSQLERETIAERIRDNMHELSKTGRWLGGTAPMGYASESITNTPWIIGSFILYTKPPFYDDLE